MDLRLLVSQIHYVLLNTFFFRISLFLTRNNSEYINFLASETYIGVASEGITGFFTGLGWGLVGTITKPAIGVLDLATGAATAVKESSRSAYND